MNNIDKLENDLWEAADQLRANSRLNQTEYSNPVLGLIFLRHATTRFNKISEEIKKELPSRGGETRPLSQDDFTQRAAIYLPEKARYDYLVDLPEKEDVGKAINDAMGLIEGTTPMLQGALPKTYNRFEKELLRTLLRIFNRDALKTAEGDVFGRIYEYFLNKFAQNQALPGGEVFTPPSLVRLIVNVIEPEHGIVFDPAAGSAGMFVQTGYFIRDRGTRPAEAVTFYGQEKSGSTVNLARMNLAVHGLEGKVVEGNTYYNDLHRLYGKCDYVMANPPFNVDAVNPERVEKDPRLFTEKTIPGVSSKTKSISNANYLWIQYFYSYLHEKGRAGFVMASSASDAGYGERDIRRELIETGAVDAVIAIGTNFFYTRSLPCTLWFFDRTKADPDYQAPAESRQSPDTVLMIDARHIFRQVNRRINDFSEEQLANLTAITWLYRGQTERYLGLVGRYLEQFHEQAAQLPDLLNFTEGLNLEEMGDELQEWQAARDALLSDLVTIRQSFASKPPQTNAAQQAARESIAPLIPRLKQLQRQTTNLVRNAASLLKNGNGNGRNDRQTIKQVEEARDNAVSTLKQSIYYFNQADWLQTRFPEGKYNDVLGLCKIVKREDIYPADDSLTPGRYVGVAPYEFEDSIVFEERIQNIHKELQALNNQANILAESIETKIEELL